MTACAAFVLALSLGFLIQPISLHAESAAEFAAARARILDEAKLDLFVREYETRVKSGSDLAKVFDFGPKHRYQREWAAVAKRAGPLPKITRRGQVLTLHFPVGDVRVDLTDFARNLVVIDGIRWAFDPSAPPRLQAELLQTKLRNATRGEGEARDAANWRWDAWLPRAEAQMPALVKPLVKPSVMGAVVQKLCKGNCTVIGVVLTGVSIATGSAQDIGTKALCYFFYSMELKTPFRAGYCDPWLEAYQNREKKERERSLTNWGALKGKLKWISDPNPKCMNKDPKGNELYAFAMTEVGPNSTTSKDKLFFSGKGSNALLTDAAIFKSEADAKAPDAAQRALAQFIFTEDPKQTAAGIPPALTYVRVLDAEKKDLVAGESGYTMVDLSKRPKDVPVAVTDKVFRYVALISNAQKWLIACQEIAESAKLNPSVVEDTVKTIISNEKDKKSGVLPEDGGSGTSR